MLNKIYNLFPYLHVLVAINKPSTHLSALNEMVREAAGPDLVVLVKRTLQEFVRITVSFFIFKVRVEEMNTFHQLTYLNRKQLKMQKMWKNSCSITGFLCQLCSLRSNSLAWGASGSKSDGGRHFLLGFTKTHQLVKSKDTVQVSLQCKKNTVGKRQKNHNKFWQVARWNMQDSKTAESWQPIRSLICPTGVLNYLSPESVFVLANVGLFSLLYQKKTSFNRTSMQKWSQAGSYGLLSSRYGLFISQGF